jgi:hypothetical protein
MYINKDGVACYASEEIQLMEQQLGLKFLPLDTPADEVPAAIILCKRMNVAWRNL